MSGRARRSTLTVLKVLAWTLGVMALLLLSGGMWLLLGTPVTDVPAGEPVRIVVVSGADAAGIATLLAEKGVVPNPWMFRLRARLSGADADLRAGKYDLRTGMAYGEVIEVLSSGPAVEYVMVTIPEGFVIEQIAQRLEEQAGIPASETIGLAKTGAAQFAKDHPYLASAYQGSLEGYLFPKTYRVAKGARSRDALELMLDQFDRELAGIDLAAAREEGFDLHQVVTIASVIEREAQLDGERPLVSSVIRNRLRRGMLLEIDATVEYVLPGNTFRLTYRDLRIDSPYNTYRYAGLPPGPISSPGLASIEAAVKPADTGYLYYVLTGKDGSHTFATNRADFLIAKQRSKEVFGR